MASWFDEWAIDYAERFAFSDGELRALLAAELALGATQAELAHSADWMVCHIGELASSPARFLGKVPMHLAFLQRYLREQRAVEYRKQAERYDHGTCTLCGGTGYVSVPHILGVKEGEWRPVKAARGGASYYTQVVHCSCGLGRWKQQQLEVKEQSMTLERYSELNPRWQIQMAKRRQQQLAGARMVDEDDPQQQAWSALVGRLVAQYGVREPGVE